MNCLSEISDAVNGNVELLFDDCSPETRRRVHIFLVSTALLADLLMFFVWK